MEYTSGLQWAYAQQETNGAPAVLRLNQGYTSEDDQEKIQLYLFALSCCRFGGFSGLSTHYFELLCLKGTTIPLEAFTINGSKTWTGRQRPAWDQCARNGKAMTDLLLLGGVCPRLA